MCGCGRKNGDNSTPLSRYAFHTPAQLELLRREREEEEKKKKEQKQ